MFICVDPWLGIQPIASAGYGSGKNQQGDQHGGRVCCNRDAMIVATFRLNR